MIDGSASSAAESSDSLGMNAIDELGARVEPVPVDLGAEGVDVVAHRLDVLLHERLAAARLSAPVAVGGIALASR